MSEKQIRVIVIDDSAYNRQTLGQMLEADPNIVVVARASDGEEGLKLVAEHRPDLITLDLEMPRMDGFTFLRILMSKMPTPVIVISSNSRKQAVFQALELGAVDFIAKPTRHISPELESIRTELVEKVLLFRHIRMLALQQKATDRPIIKAPQPGDDKILPKSAPGDMRCIAMGASTGGPPALQQLLSQFPTGTTAAILIAQHMPPKFTKAFAERLDRGSRISVKEAEEGDLVLPGRALITPGGKNMVLERRDQQRIVRLEDRQDDDRYVPSIDKMFVSAAEQFGPRLLAVVLTGMGMDGRAGVGRVRQRGGKVIAESKESAVIFGMPKEVIDAGLADWVLPLGRIFEPIEQFAFGKRTS